MKLGMRLRGIPITDWVTHCRTSQKLHLNPYSEYSATSMSSTSGKKRKYGDFIQEGQSARLELKYFPVDVGSRGFTNNNLCTCMLQVLRPNKQRNQKGTGICCKNSPQSYLLTLWDLQKTPSNLEVGSWWTTHTSHPPTQLKMSNLLCPK